MCCQLYPSDAPFAAWHLCIPVDQRVDVLQELGWSLTSKWTGRADDSSQCVQSVCPIVWQSVQMNSLHTA